MSRLFALMTLLAVLVGAFQLVLPSFASAAPKTGQAVSPAADTSVFSRELVNKVKKGVITISMMGDGSEYGMPGLMELGSGSGFIFQSMPEERTAYALTNHHVGQKTAVLQVELWDNSTYRAQLVATEPGIDIALIKIFDIPPEAYEVNVMGDSDTVVIGEPALAMGAPGAGEGFNSNRTDPYRGGTLHLTATLRVVTGKDASAEKLALWWEGWAYDLGYEVLTNLPWRFVVQTAINPGNSGGPLFNAKGEVIALNHAHAGYGATITQNENYAIPINFAKNFADQIINTGKYELPWFGMDIVFPPDLSGSVLSRSDNLQWFYEQKYDEKVLHVYNVRADSPASRAVPVSNEDAGTGLRKDDILIEFDGQTFPTVTDLRLYIFSLPIGKEVPIVVKRGHQKIDYTMTVGVKRNFNSEFSL